MKKVLVAMAVVAMWAFTACGGGSADIADDSGEAVRGQAGTHAAGADEDETEAAPPEPAERVQGGTVQVGTEVFEVEVESCFAVNTSFSFGGVGRSETNTAFVSVSSTTEDYDEDGQDDQEAEISIDFRLGAGFGPVEVGPADLIATSSVLSSGGAAAPMFEFTVDRNTMTGSGQIEDSTAIMIPAGEQLPFSFTLSC